MLFKLTAELGLTDDVVFSGKVSHPELLAYYRAADLFVSMSEHEGFGVPLIEAMWFDIPVIAFRSTAVPETLGEAGVLITDKDDLLQLAGLCNVALCDTGLRRKMIRAGRRQREKFSAQSLQPMYEQCLLSLFANG
jgi:glycosyltransferase involved in cell wall biosynthesis